MIGLLFLWHLAAYATDDFLPAFTAKYDVYVNSFSLGEGIRTLKYLPNGTIEFKSVARTTGFISLFKSIEIEELSLFKYTDGKIIPLKYTYRQTGHRARLNTIVFDWLKKVAITHFKNQDQVIALDENNILDKLLYQVGIMHALEQGQRQFDYKVIDKGKIRVYKPEFLGYVNIETGIGKLETLQYKRFSSNKKRHTSLWCASKLHYLPVKVEHVESNGDVFKLILQSVKWLK